MARALRLLNEAGLEEGGEEALAGHLGIGARHLRRLFLRHLGATPYAVAHIRRLQFAKKLIDETRLPMTQVAIAAGFGTVRRFNAAIQSAYHRTPTKIRSLTGRQKINGENHYEFHLAFRQPYSWASVLKYLADRAVKGMELIENQRYRRVFRIRGQVGFLDIGMESSCDALVARVRIDDPSLLFVTIQKLRAMFDLDADWTAIEHILKTDPLLASKVRPDPGRRIIGCLDEFEFTVRAILQQCTASGQEQHLAEKLLHAHGQPCSPLAELTHCFPSPEMLIDAKLEAIGMTARPAEAIRWLAHALHTGNLCFDRLSDPQMLLSALASNANIGSQIAKRVAMGAMRDTDAFPLSTCDLMRALGSTDSIDSKRRVESWRPWRAYALMYLDEGDPVPAWLVSARTGRAHSSVRRPQQPNTLPL